MSLYLPLNQQAAPAAYYALALPEFTMKTHTHHQCEIMYLVSGSCRIDVGAQNCRLEARQFVFIDQDVPHRLQVDAAAPALLLNLEFTCRPASSLPGRVKGVNIRSLMARQPDFRSFFEQKQPFLRLHDAGKVGYALKDLIEELEKKAGADDLMLEMLLTRLLVEIARCSCSAGTAGGIRHVRRAVTFIAAHLYEDLSVGQVAAAVGVHHTHLQKLFARHMQCGIQQYITDQRLDQAAFLLRNSHMPISEIAGHTGFNSRQHFSHMFQKLFQTRPRLYRQMHSQPLDPDTAGAQRQIDPEGRRSSKRLSQGKRPGNNDP